jgi:hypothetical protein
MPIGMVIVLLESRPRQVSRSFLMLLTLTIRPQAINQDISSRLSKSIHMTNLQRDRRRDEIVSM